MSTTDDDWVELVREAVELQFDDIPPDVVELTQQCLLDVIGCAVAGSQEPVVDVLKAVPATGTALRFGAAAHALDFDDWAPGSGAHPSAVIVPALLAAAAERPCDGRGLITAFVAAYELQERLGVAISPSHYAIGFHTTGIVGTFGAALAAALVLGADEAQIRTALTIAATEAAGLKSVFGSMGKPLNAGRAADAGVLAARLALAGFVGPAGDPVLGPAGFAVTHSSAVDRDPICRRFDADWTVRRHLFKFYPSCFGTHAAILGAESARRAGPIDLARVTGIDLTVPPIVVPVCTIRSPTTGLEGKFSISYCAAAALEDDITTASFADDLPMSPQVARLTGATTLHVDETFDKTRTVLALRLSDGSRLVRDVDAGVPIWTDDPCEARPALERKFADLADPVLGETTARDLSQRLLDLPEASPEAVGEVVATIHGTCV